MTKVFIICRDRLDGLEQLLEWVGHLDVYLVDNDSRYPPLLKFYRKTKHKVVKMKRNANHRAPWRLEHLMPTDERYIVTDPDVVPKETCPEDWLSVMNYVLDERPEVMKVGFGLCIDDLPDHYAGKEHVLKWEGPLWGNRNDVGDYKAHDIPIDTTFALYREGATVGEFESPSDMQAIRLGEPYVARHLPWYTDSSNPSEEEIYYMERANKEITNWSADGASRSHQR